MENVKYSVGCGGGGVRGARISMSAIFRLRSGCVCKGVWVCVSVPSVQFKHPQ